MQNLCVKSFFPVGVIHHDLASQRAAAALLDQQMWCLGQDIRNPEGNVLIRFGFQRHRQTRTLGRTSAYVLTPYPSSQLALWGFGQFYGQGSSGGIFLRRYQFTPAWMPHAQLAEIAWDAAGYPSCHPPCSPEERSHTRRLLSCGLRWFAGYEQWVTDTFGPDYRRWCLNSWRQATVPAESIASAWQELADSFRDGD